MSVANITSLFRYLFLTFVFYSSIAFAYRSVNIDGLVRISKDAVISNLLYNDKLVVTEEELSLELKNLYKLGFFSDVSLFYNNGSLNVKVSEVPVISSIKFNGLKKFKKDDIMKELATKERSFYSKISVISDAKKIETIYKTLGVLEVVVEPMIEFKEGGNVIVIFNVLEGKQKKIKNISFEGNRAFSDYTLKENLSFKEKAFYRMFFSSTGYNIGQMTSEVESLKRFYMANGYVNFEISRHVIHLNEKDDDVDVTFFVKEGKQYTFGNAKVVNNIPYLKSLTEKDIKEATSFKQGRVYNVNLVDKTSQKIKSILQKEGFVLSEVVVTYSFNEMQDVVDVIFTINSTKRLYVNRINFFGNLKTNDNVLRREFVLSEGDVYDIEKIRRSIQRLRNLDYFANVQVKENQVSEDRIDINVFVEEGRTLSSEFAMTYDFANSFGVHLGLTETNLLGKGLIASISGEKGQYDSALQVSFTEPYLFDRDLGFSTSLGFSRQNNERVSSYRYHTNFLSLRLSYSITEYLRHSLVYSIKTDELAIIERELFLSTNPLILKQEGDFVTSSIGHILFWDKRDNAIIPNNGHSLRFSQTLAGIGGNINYIQHEITAEKHFETFNWQDSVLSFKLRASNITGYGGKLVNIKDRFNLGGNNGLRGFDFSGVGPKVRGTKNKDEFFSYGGKNVFAGNIEYRFPNFIPREFGFTTFVFYDFGTVFGYDEEKGDKLEVLDSKKLRSSYGIGVSWRSPVGLIGISFAKVLNKEYFDETRSLYLSIGGFSF